MTLAPDWRKVSGIEPQNQTSYSFTIPTPLGEVGDTIVVSVALYVPSNIADINVTGFGEMQSFSSLGAFHRVFWRKRDGTETGLITVHVVTTQYSARRYGALAANMPGELLGPIGAPAYFETYTASTPNPKTVVFPGTSGLGAGESFVGFLLTQTPGSITSPGPDAQDSVEIDSMDSGFLFGMYGAACETVGNYTLRATPNISLAELVSFGIFASVRLQRGWVVGSSSMGGTNW